MDTEKLLKGIFVVLAGAAVIISALYLANEDINLWTLGIDWAKEALQ